jgi:DNA-binding response OmpR family regulator
LISETIVVVDDEQALLDILDISLSSHGYKVITVSNGLLAVDIIKKEHPDLVLLDIVMPEINGWEILKCLEDNQETAGLPIIMMSAIPPYAEMKQILHDDVLYYQSKPFNFDQLLQKLKTVKNSYKGLNDQVLRSYLSEKRNKYLNEIDL